MNSLEIAKNEMFIDALRINEILKTEVFDIKNLAHPLKESAFIEFIIRLNDLLVKSDKLGYRISFTEDIILAAEIKDITDAVRNMRNVACHIDSEKNLLDSRGNVFSFNMAYGRSKVMSSPDGEITPIMMMTFAFTLGVRGFI